MLRSAIRQDFPLISRHDLSYLDNAATSQMPQCVLDTLVDFEMNMRANIHRGVYSLAEKSTLAVEKARLLCADFLNARTANEIVFTHGCTQAINIVATSYLSEKLTDGDEIMITIMEHHANFLPWQRLVEKKNIKLHVIPLDDRGMLDLDWFERHLSERVKFLALTHASNVLGTINPIKAIVKKAKQFGTEVLVDGAQVAAHMKIDVIDLDVDFYVLSAHKMFAPFGVGVLYARRSCLSDFLPYEVGGGIVETVGVESSRFHKPPQRLEAGTMNISGILGLARAIEYINTWSFADMHAYEAKLMSYLFEGLSDFPFVKLVGSPDHRLPTISFYCEDVHAHDCATIMASNDVCVRSGHHCAIPLIDHFQVPSLIRLSMLPYNDQADLDRFFSALAKLKEMFYG